MEHKKKFLIWSKDMSTGHAHTYNYELTGFDLTAGIFTGLALCAVLQSAVLYQNFKPWFKNPQLTPLPSLNVFWEPRYIHSLRW